MNISTPCICGCGELVDQPTTGRAKKYLNDSHRVSHFNRNKAALKAAQANPTEKPPQAPVNTNSFLIDGIDYTRPWKHFPPSIAAYLPIQEPADLQRFRSEPLPSPVPKTVTKDFPL